MGFNSFGGKRAMLGERGGGSSLFGDGKRAALIVGV